MSSELEKEKERLAQATKTFFFHMQDLASFTNTLVELFNSSMNTQIFSIALEEDVNIEDVFEQMFCIFKEMQSIVNVKQETMQKELKCSKITMAMCSMTEKSAKAKELQKSANEAFREVQTPLFVSVLNSSNILESLESSLLLLMKYPIMNLQLSDLYRKDTKEQSDATTSEKSSGPGPSKTTTADTLNKLLGALKIENDKNNIVSAAEQLEQIVKNMGPILESLQKAIQSTETKTLMLKKANG